MEIAIYEPTNRRVIAVLDSVISLIWTERYNEPGDFELVVPATNEMLAIMELDNYVGMDGKDDWMVIETIIGRTDVENGNTLIVTGRSLLSLFERRQDKDNTAWGGGGMGSGVSVNFPLSVLHGNAFDSSDSNRDVDYIWFEYSTDTRITTDLLFQLSLDFRTGWSKNNILDKFRELASIYGIGYQMTVNSGRKFILTPYLGQDRTTSQTANPPVIISPEYGNLSSSEVVLSSSRQKNFAYSWGAPEPAPPVTTTEYIATSLPTGINRREVWVDGSIISPYISGGSTPKPTTDYQNELKELARWELNNQSFYYSFEGKAEQVTFLYGEDYFLGDIIQFEDAFGMGGEAMIVSATYAWDAENGFTINPTFEFVE